MVLLKEVVAVFPKEEAGCFSRKAREAWNVDAEEGKRERPNGWKLEAGSHFPGRDVGGRGGGGGGGKSAIGGTLWSRWGRERGSLRKKPPPVLSSRRQNPKN